MNLDTTTLVFFSPTHTTEKVVKAIGSGIGFHQRQRLSGSVGCGLW